MHSVVMPKSICHAQPKNCLYHICCTMMTSVAYREPPPYAAFDLPQCQYRGCSVQSGHRWNEHDSYDNVLLEVELARPQVEADP